MPRTEAQRRADAAYNKKVAARYKNVTCKLLAADAEQFKLRCREKGTTPNAVLTAAVKEYLKRKGG